MSTTTATTTVNHLLRLVLSCRKLTAQVTNPTTSTIIAMASSAEHEFLPHYRSQLHRFPRSHLFWDSRVASRVGEKLAVRLLEVGVVCVLFHPDQEIISRPVRLRKLVIPLFEAVGRAGVVVDGVDQLYF
ncbi:hypothetical protein vseg_014839 [Gypsophila vaccaria]